MRLFEAIVDANHRALNGDLSAGVHVGDYTDELPIVALTCIDPRLSRLFPGVLGVPSDQFIWLRNAGNILTGPTSSTMRSIALACAIKGGREIAVIGHTDCQVRKTTISQLTERFKSLGVGRQNLPENMTDFFGLFASERQNVIRGVEFVRQSPLIGHHVVVQGLLVDVETGKLEWIVNGYQAPAQSGATPMALRMPELGNIMGEVPAAAFNLGEMKFPESKIGEGAGRPTSINPPPPPPMPPPVPDPSAPARPIPIPPPIRIGTRRSS